MSAAPITVNQKLPFFSKNLTNGSPNFAVKQATTKNLKPLETRLTKKKVIKLNCMNPLKIVNNLKGNGVNPAENKISNQEKKPSED